MTMKQEAMDISPEIFRSYDIRGLVGTHLTAEVFQMLGRAIGISAEAKSQHQIVVAGDGRLSTPMLKKSLIAGLLSTGLDVIDIGLVPTPLLYYATFHLQAHSGVMVTGSHNPPEYNGLKIVIDRKALAEDEILKLHQLIKAGEFLQGQGKLKETDITCDYIRQITEDVRLARRVKVVVDCGNGAAGELAPKLLQALDCEVVPMYCDIDGRFPNHHPDPVEPENMVDLIAEVKRTKADIGIAFDGDGDRLGVVTNKGHLITADRLMMLFSQQILGRHPNSTIIYDVKCSRHLTRLIQQLGGVPLMWRTGHSVIKAKIRQTGALFGGEYSGHICFADRWYGFDDAVYCAARLLEIIAVEKEDSDTLFRQLPEDFCTPEIKIATTEEEKFNIIEQLKNSLHFQQGTMNDIDGVRVDYDDGWGLIRASNTSPNLTLRFEASTQARLTKIYQHFISALVDIAPHLDIPKTL